MDSSHETGTNGSRRCLLKKLVVLVGFAAAVYGAKKLFLDKDEQASQPFGASEYGSNGYTPQPRDQEAA